MNIKFSTLLLFLMLTLPLTAVATPRTSGRATLAVDDDRDAIILANLKMARAFMDDGDYVHAKEKAERVLQVAPNHPEALDIVERCNREAERQLARERQVYEEACSKGTVEALNNFISHYPNSPYVSEARARINDFNLWQEARRTGTVAAYQHYLSASTVKAYKDEAQKAINTLNAQAEWERLKNSTSINDIETYRRQYPGSANDADALERLNLLNAERCYRGGQHSQAITHYEEALKRHPLTGDAKAHYEELLLEREFEALKTSTDTQALTNFLTNVPPTHPYSTAISNQLAVTMAQKLNEYSTDNDYQRALNYCKDTATRTRVQSYINQAKTKRTRYLRRQRAQAHQDWWKRNFKVGLNVGYDLWEETESFHSGLRFKLGTHQDVFNLLIGCDYVWNAFWDTREGGNNETKRFVSDPIGHQIAVPLNMKLNFTSGHNSCSFYIGVAGEAGFKIAETSHYKGCMNDMSLAVEPQIGFNWKHFDWGFYYRKYLKEHNILKPEYSYDLDDQRAGMYMVLYF